MFYSSDSTDMLFFDIPLIVPYIQRYTSHKTTARKYSPRTLRELSATSFCAAVAFVRFIIIIFRS